MTTAGPRQATGADRPLLQVVLASTRPGRVGLPVAHWFVGRAEAHGGFTVELVDLAEVALPFLDEPKHPRLHQYTKQHTLEWSATVARADAFVFVMPEYNYGFNAVIKNALDFLHAEWQHKALGFVSYGGVAAGTRAVQLLKPVVSALKLAPVTEAVHIPFVVQLIGADGDLRANDVMDQGADAMLDELVAMDRVLRPRRLAR